VQLARLVLEYIDQKTKQMQVGCGCLSWWLWVYVSRAVVVATLAGQEQVLGVHDEVHALLPVVL
jgi:hypothetical protein